MIQPRDSFVTDPAEIRRLSGQSARILQRLQEGPATARELAALSLKYTSRVSDLRKAGHDVRCREEGGKSTYWLVKPRTEWHGHDLNSDFQLR